MNRYFIIALLFVCISSIANIAHSEILKGQRIVGYYDCGTMQCNFVTSDAGTFDFEVADNKVSSKIFKACKIEDICAITGDLDIQNSAIINVIKVENGGTKHKAIPTPRPQATSMMPSCEDESTRKGARMAIENSYVSAGFPPTHAEPFLRAVPHLKEVYDEIAARNLVRQWKLRSTADVRICRAELVPNSNSFLGVLIARNPKSPSQLGYVPVNIGLPTQLIVGEGWINDED